MLTLRAGHALGLRRPRAAPRGHGRRPRGVRSRHHRAPRCPRWWTICRPARAGSSQRTRGIAATVVNGEVVLRDGKHTGALPGQLLRGPARPEGLTVPKGLTAVLNQPGKPLELETLPTPEVEPGGVLIKNTAAAICGSDLHYWRNDGNYQGPTCAGCPATSSRASYTASGATSSTIAAPAAERRAIASRSRSSTRATAATGACAGSTMRARTAQRRSTQFTLNEYPFCDGGYADYYYLPHGPLRVQGARTSCPTRRSPRELRALPGALRHRAGEHEVRRRRRHPGRGRPRNLRRGGGRGAGASQGDLDRRPEAAPRAGEASAARPTSSTSTSSRRPRPACSG